MNDGKKTNLRESCPISAAFIDEMRRVFGRDEIDRQIRLGEYRIEENGVIAGNLRKPRCQFELKRVAFATDKKRKK